MATPMTADQFVKALKNEGVNVQEYAGWRTHNRNHKGSWGGVNGVVIHHTAGSNSLNFVYNGNSSLPGPLCHTHLAKNGTATMVGNGRANHAGTFAQNAHDAVIAEKSVHPRPSASEPVDGNAHYYGIEIENLGNGKDYYPQEQYDTAVKWAAAICRFHGWTAQSVIGHKEGTTRKIDPKGPVGSAKGSQWDMDEFRKDVQARLGKKPEVPKPAPVSYEPYPGAAYFKKNPKSSLVTRMGKRLVAEGCSAYSSGPGPQWTESDRKSYRKWQLKLGYRGSDADGYPGKASWDKLKVPKA